MGPFERYFLLLKMIKFIKSFNFYHYKGRGPLLLFEIGFREKGSADSLILDYLKESVACWKKKRGSYNRAI